MEFPTVKTGDRLTADHVNALSEAAGLITGVDQGSGQEIIQSGSLRAAKISPTTKIRFAELTDDIPAFVAGATEDLGDLNATILLYDDVAEDWILGDDDIHVSNPFDDQDLQSGDRLYVYFNGQGGRWLPIRGGGGSAFPVSLTSTSGTGYLWKEVKPTSAGTWAILSGGRVGTTSSTAAFEADGIPAQINDVVYVETGFLDTATSTSDVRFQHSSDLLQGTFAADVAAGATATMTITSGGGATVSVKNIWSSTVKGSKTVIAGWVRYVKLWVVIAADC